VETRFSAAKYGEKRKIRADSGDRPYPFARQRRETAARSWQACRVPAVTGPHRIAEIRAHRS
jgi:hypothetical protein